MTKKIQSRKNNFKTKSKRHNSLKPLMIGGANDSFVLVYNGQNYLWKSTANSHESGIDQGDIARVIMAATQKIGETGMEKVIRASAQEKGQTGVKEIIPATAQKMDNITINSFDDFSDLIMNLKEKINGKISFNIDKLSLEIPLDKVNDQVVLENWLSYLCYFFLFLNKTTLDNSGRYSRLQRLSNCNKIFKLYWPDCPEFNNLIIDQNDTEFEIENKIKNAYTLSYYVDVEEFLFNYFYRNTFTSDNSYKMDELGSLIASKRILSIILLVFYNNLDYIVTRKKNETISFRKTIKEEYKSNEKYITGLNIAESLKTYYFKDDKIDEEYKNDPTIDYQCIIFISFLSSSLWVLYQHLNIPLNKIKEQKILNLSFTRVLEEQNLPTDFTFENIKTLNNTLFNYWKEYGKDPL